MIYQYFYKKNETSIHVSLKVKWRRRPSWETLKKSNRLRCRKVRSQYSSITSIVVTILKTLLCPTPEVWSWWSGFEGKVRNFIYTSTHLSNCADSNLMQIRYCVVCKKSPRYYNIPHARVCPIFLTKALYQA